MLNSESDVSTRADVSGNQGTDFRYVPKEGFGWTNGELHDTIARKLTS
jgi:neutral trehalase